MKSNSLTLILTILIFLVFYNQLVYTQNNKIKVSVEILVDSKSSIIEERLSSFLKRELRALNDVEIVEENENLRLRVMAMENSSRSGEYKYGYTLSVISLFPTQCNSISIYSFLASTMFTSPEDALSSTSEDIVAWFDYNSIEITRKFYNDNK